MAMNKTVVATVCVVVSAAAVGGGLWLRSGSAPLALPANADEAVAGLRSDAYGRMDDQRRRQYAFEAGKLLRERFEEMSEEERQAMREDEDLREALRAARDDMFEEMVRRAARGDGMERPQWGPPGGRQRPNPDEMTDEQREQMEERREAMRERIADQMRDMWDSGDAQSSGLRQEFFKTRMGGGGGGRRGGGR